MLTGANRHEELRLFTVSSEIKQVEHLRLTGGREKREKKNLFQLNLKKLIHSKTVSTRHGHICEDERGKRAAPPWL